MKKLIITFEVEVDDETAEGLIAGEAECFSYLCKKLINKRYDDKPIDLINFNSEEAV